MCFEMALIYSTPEFKGLNAGETQIHINGILVALEERC